MPGLILFINLAWDEGNKSQWREGGQEYKKDYTDMSKHTVGD